MDISISLFANGTVYVGAPSDSILEALTLSYLQSLPELQGFNITKVLVMTDSGVYRMILSMGTFLKLEE